MKICFIILILFLCEFSYCFIKLNLNDYTSNPYRVFNLPPWSSMKVIKKRYNELVLKYHPDKSGKNTKEQFQLVKDSYQAIKKERKEHEDSEQEISFKGVLRKLIRSIFNVEILFMVVYVISYIIFQLQILIVVPVFYLILSFTVVDNMFPHYFNDTSNQYLYCIIIGVVLYLIHRRHFKSEPKGTKNNLKNK